MICALLSGLAMTAPPSAGADALSFSSFKRDFSTALHSFRTEVRRRFRRRHYYRYGRRLGNTQSQKQEETAAAQAESEAHAEPPPEPARRPVFPGEKPRQLTEAKPPAAVVAPPPPVELQKPVPPAEAAKPLPAGPPAAPPTWSEAEVLAGLSECLREVSGKKIVFEALKPIKDGACGLPAPILLKSFQMEKGPSLAINPSPTISCRMASALRRWIDEVVQPEAQRRLNAVIVTFTNASAYQCRNQNNNPSRRLSEHAAGNALDIATFVTAKGETISVLDHWNSTGGRGEFLHAVHDGACAIFGTTLGPEANEYHRNHFHLDMTPRRKGLCDFTPDQVALREKAKQQRALVMAKQLLVRRIQFGFAKRPNGVKRITSR